MRAPGTWAKVNENYFEDIDSEEKAYWLGYMAGGSTICHRSPKSWAIMLRSGNKAHLGRFCKSIETDAFVKTRYCDGGRPYHYVSFSSAVMAADLRRYHIMEQRAKTVRFPYGLDPGLVRFYSRGFLDSNSHIYANRGNLFLGISGTMNVCQGMQNIIEEGCDIKHAPRRVQKCNRFISEPGSVHGFRAQFTGNVSVPRIMNWSYDGSKIHDFNRYKKIRGIIRRTIGR